MIEDQANLGIGNAQRATGPGIDGGGLHSDPDDFWKSSGSWIESLARRNGAQLQPDKPTSQSSDPDYQEFLRWKAAKEGKDPRQVLELAGLQPRDALDAMIFGGTQKEEPKIDPVEQMRNELKELKTSIQQEREQRQSVQEKIEESKAKATFADKVRSMEDLTLVKRWGNEAIDTAWNLFASECEAAMKARAQGMQFEMPSFRKAAVQVENYLRRQASALGDVIGSSVQLEPIDFMVVPGSGADSATVQKAGIGPTLTNVSGHSGTSDKPEDFSPETLRKRALEAAKRLRG